MNTFSTIFQQHRRSIGIIVPDVVISEKHQDSLKITEHPVERPSAGGLINIADHAYVEPAKLTMEVGFASGGSLLDFADTTKFGISLNLSPQELYQQLLDLQRSRELFDVTTGKRQYKNMILRAIAVTTDAKSENVLMATLSLQEVVISDTNSIQVADKSEMSSGVNTSAVQNSGVKAATPVNQKIVVQSWSATGGS